MYGGSGKLGRGGGGGRGAAGGNKRNIHSTFHPPPPHHRPSSAAAASVAPAHSGRLSMGGAGAAQRNRVASASAASAAASASSAATEESFSLVTGNPLNFAMIIRLAPDLVEEIKRVESQGSTARIKFDANANNPAGNVISVGGKDFRFTWSREPGDLCDIYEERQSGEDGNGLLVESGSAWRKLNVQRVLDESTKNHVKMRSEEAERKLRARKAIVLDHGNPSMKNNVKAMVAAESTSSWRMKGAPFKKRKAEPPPGGPPKSVQRSALTTTPPSKGRPPASSPSSPPEQSVATGSPVGGNLMKGQTDIEDTVSVQAMNKTVSSEKDAAGRVVSSAGRGKQGQKALKGAQPADLQSMLISLLGESPSKGMSLMALEKAIGDALPNSARQIEPILKKIATLQAPGRYFLKPGVEVESFKKPPVSEGQSSPEDNHQSPAHDGQQPALDTTFSVRSEAKELERAELDHKYEEANNLVERGDVSRHSTDLSCEKKVSDNSEGPVGSSSDSGSDSDSESDSSDSGSDSGTHSRSRSRSAGGSGSGSSSDSESDASTKSKEASDEDVDIMTSDDDKQVKHKLEASTIGPFKSPPLWRNSDSEHEKQDGHVSDIIEIEKDFPEDQPVREVAAPSDSVRNQEGQKVVEETMPPLFYHNLDQEKHEYTAKIHGESGNVSKDGFKLGQSASHEKSSRGKYKRVLDEKQEDKPDRSKKLKPGNSQQPLVSGSRIAPFQGSHQNSSPDRPFEDITRGPNNQVANRSRRDINSSSGSHKSYDQTSSGKSISDSQQPIQRSIDPNSRAKTSTSVEKPGKHSENMGRSAKPPDKLQQMTEGFPLQKDKFNREMQDVYSSIGHKGPVKVSKEDFVEKHTTPVDTRYRKHEAFGNLKESGSVLNSPKDENPNLRDRSVVNGRPNVLQRELSDLELGELRESLPEETPGLSKQLNRKSSFKQSENWKPDSSKAKPASKMNAESRKSSPLNANISVSGIAEGMPKRGIPEHSAGDNSKPHPRGMQIQHSRYHSRVDNVDNGTQLNRLVESSGRNRHGDVGTTLDINPEVNGNFPSKGLATISQEHEAKQVAAPSRKDSRRLPDLNDKQKDSSLTGSSDGYQKRIESSSDENSCPYSKYEKDEPEFKGPIKDGSQYKEYVDEFQEKYGIYCSLNKILESYREEFLKYERDLDASKGKDMQRYYNVERQIKESYSRCGERFKRLRKTFLVLHDELQHLKQMIHDFATPYLKDIRD